MLNVVMLSVVKLNIIVLSVVMLNVVVRAENTIQVLLALPANIRPSWKDLTGITPQLIVDIHKLLT